MFAEMVSNSDTHTHIAQNVPDGSILDDLVELGNWCNYNPLVAQGDPKKVHNAKGTNDNILTTHILIMAAWHNYNDTTRDSIMSVFLSLRTLLSK